MFCLIIYYALSYFMLKKIEIVLVSHYRVSIADRLSYGIARSRVSRPTDVCSSTAGANWRETTATGMDALRRRTLVAVTTFILDNESRFILLLA